MKEQLLNTLKACQILELIFINVVVSDSYKAAGKVPINISGMSDDDLCNFIKEEYQDFGGIILINQRDLKHRFINVLDSSWFDLELKRKERK